MSFIEEFKNRGYFYQCTNEEELSRLMKSKSVPVYIGFDCTAKSLHIGSLMQIMILRLLQKYGHKPIILIGGATTKIGDPTFKDEMRKFLSDEEIQENVKGIKKSLSKFIKFGNGESDAIMLDNSQWLESLGYIEFLRDYGRYFSINRMLTMDSVRLRIEREQSLSFLEFNYMLLQAYDFYYLRKNYDCLVQLGGSDQWGNIVTGVDLTRRVTGDEVFGLTTPLLTTSSGAKMGKSASGAVWINEDMLDPYDYFQYWRNVEDDDVVRFAKLYCEFDDQELKQFIQLSKQDINEAKKSLAYRVTELCHGSDEADKSLATAKSVFEQGGINTNLPTVEIPRGDLEQGVPCIDLFVKSTLASSKGEVRRLIRGKGGRLNDKQITDEDLIVGLSDIKNGYIKLSAGKKKHALIKPV